MPMYDYRCKQCGTLFEELVFSSSIPDDEIKCPECGVNQAVRLLSAPMVSTKSSVSEYPCERYGECSPTSGFS